MLLASKKREWLLNDWPAMSAIAIFQMLEATPIFPVYRGQWKETGIMLDSQHGTGGGNGRPPWVSSGTHVGHSPGALVAQPAPCIRQLGAGTDNTPRLLSPSSAGANASYSLVSWIPHQGRTAEKCIR